MISSARCSSSRGRAAATAILAASLAATGCRHGTGALPSISGTTPAPTAPVTQGASIVGTEPGGPADATRERLRIIVLPLHNLTGSNAPMKELAAAIELALARRFDVLTGSGVEEFLARHRMRYTGGIDEEEALAAREELGADAVLITSLQARRAAGPPALGITMRLVAAGAEPTILWMDQASRAGDESPGLLRLGIIESLEPIQHEMIARLVRSLEATLDGERRSTRCEGDRRYRPRIRARSPMLDSDERYSLAVIPFFNLSSRRDAGEAVALDVVRQLVATRRYRVLEPGVVRAFLLKRRIIMPGGVSLEATRLLLGALGVQLVASGTVFDYEESGGSRGPTIRFSMVLLDGGTGEVVWHSTSFNHGDDGVFAFGLGRVATSGRLTSRMICGVVDQLTRGKTGPVPQIARSPDPVRDAIERRKPPDRPEGRGGKDSVEAPLPEGGKGHEGP